MTAEAYIQEIGERTRFDFTLEHWLAARCSAMTLNEAAFAIAKEISDHCQIAVLTNNSRLVPKNMARLCSQIASLFGPHIYASAQFRSAKPNTEVYRRCLDELGVAMSATALFIDDLSTNVPGAIVAGPSGIFLLSLMSSLPPQKRSAYAAALFLSGSLRGRR